MLLEIIAVASLSLGASTNDAKPVVKNCLTVSQLRSTAVIDDKTVLFELRNRSVWVNKLKFKCPSLGFYESFSYEVHGNSICDIDVIRVFAQNHIGASCGLSKFERVEGRLSDVRKAMEAQSKAEQAAVRR
jgi:hypothetical protein